MILMISIEIISKGEQSIFSTLESIKKQTIQDYEIIVADSSENEYMHKSLVNLGCDVVKLPKETRALLGRYIAHQKS